MKEIFVIKRNGQKEPLNYEKINKVLIWATTKINNVSASDVAMNASLQIYDGMSTTDIHKVLIQSANNLISEETPNYQYVASNLINFFLRKNIFNSVTELPHIADLIKSNVEKGVYDKSLLENYTYEELDKINDLINHNRDFNFTSAGIQQLIDKYLVKDRVTGEIYETPQYMYLLIGMVVFAGLEPKTRLKNIKRFYEAASKHKINLPTPIMAGVRTPSRQYSSCVLIDVDDSKNSILSSITAVGDYTAAKAGIGLNMGGIRSVGSKIRNGEVIHTGPIPFLKMFEATVKAWQQNGIRGGSATVHFPIWHKDIEDILVLKNNKGSDDNRVRKLDYSIQLSHIFYKRFLENGDITLFSPNEVPDLYKAFGYNEVFDELYVKYENDETLVKKTVKARDLFTALAQERLDTGRIYIMNIDHANSHSAFLDKIMQSNLCQEVNLPTSPIKHIDDTEGEIALCVLGAINLGAIKDLNEIEELMDIQVRMLDFIIETQDYPVEAAKKMLQRRSLGIGVTNLAYFLAKNGLAYDDPKTLVLLDEVMEYIQYYGIKASVNLAKEFGKCGYFDRTKYSKGILPIDTYNKFVDTLVNRPLTLDWEKLREEVLVNGMRNSCITAFMPAESSSLPSNATNGIETPRATITSKKSKQGVLKVVLPELQKLKNKYTYAFSMKDNTSINNICAVIQKYTDQGISVNHYYDPTKFEGGEIPISVIIRDILYFYKTGGKQMYYANTYDGKSDDFSEETKKEEDESCGGGGCTL